MFIADIGVECPNCGNKFSSKQLPVLLDTGKRNSELRQDFGGVIPQFEKYAVSTCPKCGQANWVNQFQPLEVPESSLPEQANMAPHLQFKEAARGAERRNKESYWIALLYLYAAWCADDENAAQNAKEYRRLAAQWFQKSLADRSCPIQNRLEIEYVIGELLRRMGDFDGARAQFQQAIPKLSGKYAYMTRKLMRLAELGKTEAIPFEILNRERRS